jgi:hypothetical protein
MTSLDIGQVANRAGAPMPGEMPVDYLGNLRCGDCKWRADAYNVKPEDDCYHPEADVMKGMFGFKVGKDESGVAYSKIPPNFPADRSIRDLCPNFVLDMRGD